MNVFIVDDERPARGLLSHHLNKIEDITIVGQSGDPLEAIDEINHLKPDLIFLDIEMPLLNGFEMLDYLKHRPIVIFCTAFDQHALKAFEVNALDYLLKPYTEDRLAESLKRAKNEWKKLENLQLPEDEPLQLKRIVCSQGTKKVVINLSEVLHFKKVETYTALITIDGNEYLTPLTLSHIEERLPEQQFFRVDRQNIIHLKVVESFQTEGSGFIEITSSKVDGLQVSRRRAKAFREWLAGAE